MIFAIVGREIKIIRGGNYGPAARKWKWKREYRINLGPRGGIIIPLGLFYILFNLLRGIEKPLPSMAYGFLCLGPHLRAPPHHAPSRISFHLKASSPRYVPRFFHPKIVFPRVVVVVTRGVKKERKKERKKKKIRETPMY